MSYTTEYYQRNKERIKLKVKEWQSKNKEKFRAKQREYWHNNKHEISAKRSPNRSLTFYKDILRPLMLSTTPEDVALASQFLAAAKNDHECFYKILLAIQDGQTQKHISESLQISQRVVSYRINSKLAAFLAVRFGNSLKGIA